MTQSTIGRRGTLGLGLAAGAAALAPRTLRAQTKDVEIAMLVPLSGPWAREGILEKMGAEMAVDDVNKAGGIKALGGAKLKLLEFDTQDTAEKAKDAVQRMLAQNPNVVGGFGCWLSTFTLAVTEVTERAHLPWLTLSYSDLITGRGYKYVFQSSPTAVQQAEDMVPVIMALAEKATGKRPTKVASIGDNTAASVSFRKPIDAHVLKDEKLTEVIHEIYTPPLSDATTLVQPVRAARPDFVLLTSTNVPDDKLLLDDFNEFGMPPSKLPLIGNGGHWAVPELLKNTSKDELEGMLVGLANWPGKAVEDVSERFVKRTGEPWFGHDSIFAYAHVLILAAALEKAGAADREKVNAAIHAMDTTTGPALFFPGHHLQYDAQGRRVGAKMVMVQWQDARPVTVFPPDVAVAPAKWKA
ncbi:MAG TPA: ABC transporter substrate-binding protein [Acetobacteraceae bacterium]|nr:ABC transporter substrate-binding protein [Acetobacteraceae bacterium]